jgi:hypothetical protein
MGRYSSADHESFLGAGGFALPNVDDTKVVRAAFPAGVVATVGGILTLAAGTDTFRVSGTEDFIGISTSGAWDGRLVFLTFTQARDAKHGQSVPVGSAPLEFYYVGPTLVDTITFPRAGGRLTLQYNASIPAWQVVAGPYL